MSKRILTVPLLVLALGAVTIPAAVAGPSHPRSVTITVSPASAPVGSTFTVTVSGLTSNDALQMYVWQGPYASQTVIDLASPVNGTTSATFTGSVAGAGSLAIYAEQYDKAHRVRWAELGRTTFTVT